MIFFVLLYEQCIKACEVLVKACFQLKDKVCILLVSEIYGLVFTLPVQDLGDNIINRF